MRDDVHLAAAGLLHELLDTLGEFSGAVLHGSRRLLLAVEYHGSVGFKLRWDTPPVVHQLAVPEEHPVHEQQRVFRAA